MDMPRSERFGLIIALRELEGYKYLGRGRWKEPDWVIEQRKQARKAQRKR
jgi:hypothetical protein